MRSPSELEPIAFHENLSAEEDDVLFEHYVARAEADTDARSRMTEWKHAAFFAGRAFDKGMRSTEKLAQYADALNMVQKLAPTASFRRKLNEIKAVRAGKGARDRILKRLARMGDAGSQKLLASEEEIVEIEKSLALALPPSYRQYLMKYAHRQIGNYEPFPARELVGAVQVARDCGLEDHLLPFLEDNADYFCFDLRSKGPEFSVAHRPHNSASDETWPNFAAWVEECWLAELGE